jgi:arylsulfatase A-like enzyme
VDLFATIAELAGVRAEAEDSVSLVPYLHGRREPLRDTVYAEHFRPNFVPAPDSAPRPLPSGHTRAVRNQRFKLVRFSSETGQIEERLFDLALDPCEEHDLAPGFGPADPARLTPLEAANLRALQAELVALGVF